MVARPGGYINEALERPDRLKDPRYCDKDARVENVASLDAEIEAWTGLHTKKEVMEILCAHKVVAGAVLSVKESLKSADTVRNATRARVISG